MGHEMIRAIDPIANSNNADLSNHVATIYAFICIHSDHPGHATNCRSPTLKAYLAWSRNQTHNLCMPGRCSHPLRYPDSCLNLRGHFLLR